MTDADILLAAARGNLSRWKIGGRWRFAINHEAVCKRKPILDLMRRGLIVPMAHGLPGVAEDIEITVKGREALRRSMHT